MKRFQNIIYVSNGIIDENDAIKQALKLADDNQASLKAYIICPPFPNDLEAYKKTYTHSLKEQLEKAINKARSALKISEKKLPVSIDIECGKAPNTRIIQYVLQHAHDLVIKEAEVENGSKGYKALDMELLRTCPCALYLSKPFKHAQKKAKVAVAIDPKDIEPEARNLSLKLLSIASSLAQHYSDKLDILTCWLFAFEDYLRDNVWVKMPEEELNQKLEQEKEDTRLSLKTLMEEANISEQESQVNLLKGQPANEIPSFISDNKIDILVMGTVARTGLKGFIIGNTAENILQKLDCSLLALKPQSFVSPISPD